MKQGGKFFLLPSLPLVLEKRELRVPKKNFFTETLYRARFAGQILVLHKWIRQDWNNPEVREIVKKRTLDIVDSALAVVCTLRTQKSGWSVTCRIGSLWKIQIINDCSKLGR